MFNWFGFRTRQLEEKLNDIPSNIPLRRAALQELADAAVHRVIRRTERGRDYKDKPFKPYSESYLNALAITCTSPLLLTKWERYLPV